MIKFCVEQWDKNKDKLEQDIRSNLSYYNDTNYKGIVKKVVQFIFNNNEDNNDLFDDGWDAEGITEINNGDYQGTLLYVIPQNTYQPSEYEYLMTYVNYGSCSGCDALESIQMWSFDDDEEFSKDKKEQFIEDMMKLCLHLVQNTIKPYSSGWYEDEQFNPINE